jgi:hypothetical protein
MAREEITDDGLEADLPVVVAHGVKVAAVGEVEELVARPFVGFPLASTTSLFMLRIRPPDAAAVSAPETPPINGYRRPNDLLGQHRFRAPCSKRLRDRPGRRMSTPFP